MSREIKFRVFDKDLKSMHICGENEHDSISFLKNQACYYNLQNGCGSLPSELGEGTYELMQFTGLTTKDGTDVYEGDIVDIHDAIYEVKFECGGFMAGEMFLDDYWNLYGYMFKVIGNKFDNPELLEVKE